MDHGGRASAARSRRSVTLWTSGGSGGRLPTPLTGSTFQATGCREALDVVANFSFYIDSLTLTWMLFVTGLATLIALYASEYMSHDVGAGYCRFFAAFNLFVFSMSCLVMGDNLILLCISAGKAWVCARTC
jgi:NADH:ubiquinone oxidoreductase subunit 5 (subunit L)/multisubunit Na+/H+ antiporter MnhA subunit